MPMLKIPESRKITATVTLEETTALLTDRYAAYTMRTADAVVNAALDYVFANDKSFKAFCEGKSKAKPMAALRVKRSPASEKRDAAQESGAEGSGLLLQNSGHAAHVKNG